MGYNAPIVNDFLQYNLNNHILDGGHYVWSPIAFPGGEFVSVLSKGLLNFDPCIENAGYAPESNLELHHK